MDIINLHLYTSFTYIFIFYSIYTCFISLISGLSRAHRNDAIKHVITIISRDPGAMQDARPVTVQQRMASALGGSLVTSLVVTPLDVVKVRLQAQSLVPPIIDTCCGDFVFCTRHLECPPIPIREPRMTGIMDAFGTIVRTEGVAALWRGLGASLCAIQPPGIAPT